jgi:hypothetical protein
MAAWKFFLFILTIFKKQKKKEMKPIEKYGAR